MKYGENCSRRFREEIKKTHTILYMYITGGGEEGQEQMTPREQNFDCNQKMLLL